MAGLVASDDGGSGLTGSSDRDRVFRDHPEVDVRSPWWGEYRSRYLFAARHARARRVVDLGIGSGSGCSLLLDTGAGHVLRLGLSRAAPVVRSNDDALLACLSASSRLPVKDDAAEVVVCLEGFSALASKPAFLSEVRRILGPDGTFIASVRTGRAWHASSLLLTEPHMAPDSFDRALAGAFDRVTLYGQRVHGRFPVSPWDTTQPRRFSWTRFSWKAQRLVPFMVAERASRLIHNRSFYPSEYDFEFVDGAVKDVHSVIAICR